MLGGAFEQEGAGKKEICMYYDEARNRIHARNGETEETTEEVVSSPLLVCIDLLALLYVLHA